MFVYFRQQHIKIINSYNIYSDNRRERKILFIIIYSFQFLRPLRDIEVDTIKRQLYGNAWKQLIIGLIYPR